MGQSYRDPWPYEVRLASASLGLNAAFMLARSPTSKAPIWSENVPPPSDIQEVDVLYEALYAGLGVRDDRNVPETRHAYYAIGAASAGGGVDLSYGRWMKSALLTNTTVLAASKICSIVQFSGVAYMAIGTKIYSSATQLWTDAVVSYSAAGNVTRLIPYQGNNSIPLLFAAIANGAYATFDGTTWATDDASLERPSINPQGVVKSVDAEISFTDYTAAVTDGNTATTMDLSSLDTLANGDAWYIGHQQVFTKATYTFGTFNGNASVLSGHYWTGSAWAALSITDGTIAAVGKTMGQNGSVTWTRPAAQWSKAVLTAFAANRAFYWTRWTVSAVLDASTTVQSISIRLQEEAEDFGISGSVLWAGYNDGTSIKSTVTGGRKATWNKTTNDLGPGDGRVTGLAAVQGSIFVKRTTDLSSPDASGRIIPYNSELYRPPSTAGEGAMIAHLDRLWYSHGYTMYAWSPTSGPEVLGPERLVFSDDASVAMRITALVADRAAAVYGFGYSDVTATSVLYKWGSYRQAATAEGGLDWVRTDALHQTHVLGSRKITAAAIYYVSDQPYLVFGDAAGVVTTSKLCRGTNPQEAQSGFAFNTIDSYLYLPTQHGTDPSRTITPTAWTLDGRALSATNTVALATKAPSDTSWTTQSTDSTTGKLRAAFDTVTNYDGVDQRLTFSSAASSSSPIVQAMTLHVSQPARSTQRVYQFAIDVSDQITRRDGTAVDTTSDDWLDVLDALCDAKTPLVLTKPNGRTDTVMFRDRTERYLPAPEGRLPHQVITLTFATAA